MPTPILVDNIMVIYYILHPSCKTKTPRDVTHDDNRINHIRHWKFRNFCLNIYVVGIYCIARLMMFTTMR